VSAALLAALGAATLAAGGFGLRREAKAERNRRLHALDDCLDLVERPSLAVHASGYAILRGRFRGYDVALRPIHEQLVFRRLPQLWLLATLRTPTGGPETLDILRRPMGGEFFSIGESLPRSFAPPAPWPQDTAVRGSRDAGALIKRLSAPLASILADDRVKTLTITPGGVRAVRGVRQGDRGAYLLFRDSRFGDLRIPRQDAQAALELVFDLAQLASHGDRDERRAA
jgi:hypothetical protein